MTDQYQPVKRQPGRVNADTPPASSRSRRRRRRRDRAGHGSSSAEPVAAFLAAFAVLFSLATFGAAFDLVAQQRVALVIWIAIALAIAFGVLPRATSRRELVIPAAAMLALVGWTAVSMLWTDSLERTFGELGRVLLYAGVATLAYAGLHRGSWRAAAAGAFAAALLVTLGAVASRLFPAEFPGAAAGVAFAGGRLSYPLDYWNALGAWAAATGVLGLGFGVCAARRWTQGLALATVPVSTLAVYLSYSRGGIVALLLGSALVLLISPQRERAAGHALVAGLASAIVIAITSTQPEIADSTGGSGGTLVGLSLIAASTLCFSWGNRTRRSRSRRRTHVSPRIAPRGRVVLVTVALGAAAAIFAVVATDNRAASAPRFVDDTSPAGRLVSLKTNRADIWSSGLDAAASSPLGGIGAGTFGYWWAADARASSTVIDAHSLYLETAAELGVPALLALLAFGAGAVRLALASGRASRSGATVGLTAALVGAFGGIAAQAGVDWLWEVGAVGALGIGAITIAGSAGSSRRSRSRRLTPRRLAAVVLALAAAAVQVPSLVAAERVRNSAAALEQGLPALAQERADEAVTAEPWAASPYAQRAGVELAAGRLSDARADAQRAIANEPTNWEHPALLARIELEAANDAATLGALSEVERLRPVLGPLVQFLAQGLDP